MKLTALGVGDAFSARYWSTCAVVEHEGRRLLVDCPHPIRRVLGGSGLDVGDLDAVVVTHCHADHCSGLEGLLYFARFVLGRKVVLAAHPEVLTDLWEGHLRAGMHRLLEGDGARTLVLADYAEVVPLSLDAPVDVGPFRLACRRTVHHVPTFALRIAAGGHTLGWSADTAFDEDLVAWLAEADRVVHETNFGPAHTPLERLLALPEAVRARLWLVHYPDGFDVERSAIPCLREGHVYDVG